MRKCVRRRRAPVCGWVRGIESGIRNAFLNEVKVVYFCNGQFYSLSLICQPDLQGHEAPHQQWSVMESALSLTHVYSERDSAH